MEILGIITGVLGIALAIYSIYDSKKSDKEIKKDNNEMKENTKEIINLLIDKPQIETKKPSADKKVLTAGAGKILEYFISTTINTQGATTS